MLHDHILICFIHIGNTQTHLLLYSRWLHTQSHAQIEEKKMRPHISHIYKLNKIENGHPSV